MLLLPLFSTSAFSLLTTGYYTCTIRNILRDANDMFGTCTKDSQSLSLGTPDEEGHPLKFLKLGWGTTVEQEMQKL